MRLHTNVLLNISDYSTRVASPPRFMGLLFGIEDKAMESYELASSDQLEGEIESGERLALMEAVSPGISIIGVTVVGHGLDPQAVSGHLGGLIYGYLLLVELPKHDMPVAKAFKARYDHEVETVTSWESSELRLVSDEATDIAVSDALKVQGSADFSYAKRILRDKVVELQHRLLESDDEKEKRSIVMKYGQLKKTAFGGSSGALEPRTSKAADEHNIAYDLMTQVIKKSDERHVKTATTSENGSIIANHHMYV